MVVQAAEQPEAEDSAVQPEMIQTSSASPEPEAGSTLPRIDVTVQTTVVRMPAACLSQFTEELHSTTMHHICLMLCTRGYRSWPEGLLSW